MPENRVTIKVIKRAVEEKVGTQPETELVQNLRYIAGLIRQLRYVRHRAYAMIEDVCIKILLNGISPDNRRAMEEIINEFGQLSEPSQNALKRYKEKYKK
jgi:hypothetical protein